MAKYKNEWIFISYFSHLGLSKCQNEYLYFYNFPTFFNVELSKLGFHHFSLNKFC